MMKASVTSDLLLMELAASICAFVTQNTAIIANAKMVILQCFHKVDTISAFRIDLF